MTETNIGPKNIVTEVNTVNDRPGTESVDTLPLHQYCHVRKVLKIPDSIV